MQKIFLFIFCYLFKEFMRFIFLEKFFSKIIFQVENKGVETRQTFCSLNNTKMRAFEDIQINFLKI